MKQSFLTSSRSEGNWVFSSLSTLSVLLRGGFPPTSAFQTIKAPSGGPFRLTDGPKDGCWDLINRGQLDYRRSWRQQAGRSVKAKVILMESLSELSGHERHWYLLIDYLPACLASLRLFLPFNSELFSGTSHRALFFYLSLCHLLPLHLSSKHSRQNASVECRTHTHYPVVRWVT